ncbi:hypothetical protein CSB07_00660 [Candidatus Gracilibacteria bacterium]|nr:MAG: hypothetical protein CSB07_00660 [Candidatus Gracilibacteria bacterium]
MKNLKTVAYSSAGLGLLAISGIQNTFAAQFNYKVGNSDFGDNRNINDVIVSWLNYLAGFLYLIAVIYGIWGGFTILTAGGDEEKVKKGRTILINAIIGLVVIFLVSTIINLVINGLFPAT